LADLFAAIGSMAVDEACVRLSSPADVSAVVCATFEEVWWLARFHTAADTDVRAWITAIVARRAADQLRAVSDRVLAADLGTINDERYRLTLMGLLDGRAVLDFPHGRTTQTTFAGR
jgi:DNA-directed RNA polymerase specialized sigma24 family protein